MTTNNACIIGSSDTCDIVLEQATVSGKHCRIVWTTEGFTIEDLGSTNGTFVNGVRIFGPTRVAATDKLTLGKSVPLSWDSIADLACHKVITIGRAADNDVILDSPNVSAYHARLLIEDDKLILEDLGSTNGTALGSIDRKITRVPLTNETTVFFGSTPVPVSTLLGKPAHDTTLVDAAKSPSSDNRWMWVAASLAVFVFLLLSAVSVDHFSKDRSVAGSDEDAASEQASVIAATPTATDRSSQPDESAHTRQNSSPAAKHPDRVSTDDLQHALFWVTVSDPEGDEVYRLGTAWAVAPRTLVTSASVIAAAESLNSDGYPTNRLVSPTGARSLAIHSTRVHREFTIAAQAAQAVRLEHDRLLASLEASAPDTVDLNNAKTAMVDLWQKGLKASEQQAYYDVGLLNVGEDLSVLLPLAPDTANFRPKMKVHTLSLAFDIEDPFLAPNVTALPLKLTGRIHQLVRFANGAQQITRLCVESEPGQLEVNMMGSPILNAEGDVLAMYSRPTPSPDRTRPPSGATFDAVLVRCIRDLLNSDQ